jgi:23S rRNA (adenine2503-C2)-methyltransferase
MDVLANEVFGVPLADGLTVEAVYYGSGTLCISTQAGCAVGCAFCASGSLGLKRNLTLQELHFQVEEAHRRGFRPVRVTLSGIGDPLHNADATFAFIESCSGRNLPVSLTTTGRPLATLEKFLRAPHNGLMISLHASSPRIHRLLIPHGPSFQGLWRLLAEVLPGLSRRRRRKIGINYLLLEGINDSPEELSRLVRCLRPFPELTLHLLTCNPVPGHSFHSPPASEVEATCEFFRRQGVNVRRPNPWRRRPEGGCGTLFLKACDGE